ncbi:L,D-transpeptidase family protein [Rhodovulum tesquicola]|uniref:L,D-transpeptidase family protein n=1 Tax=Rhodovulum tesquicola TaxID=540254 RepID=UPI0020984B59|nr:L,D-transpeptidase family protein [Rhodovulum tesquicola]MCO8144669.1 L,D-transpeptidase family protein [Rhodovulum tesquicola]
MKRIAGLFSHLALALLAAGAVVLALGLIAPRMPAPPPPLTGPVDRIEVVKSDRRMTLFVGDLPVRSYAIALGFDPEGHKQAQGDGRTPEGRFHIDRRNPQSSYHLSLGLNYPRPEDRANAERAGVNPGGDIFIHGQPPGIPRDRRLGHDWTAGCIALSNAEMDELWRVVPLGTPVDILP